MGQVGQVYGQDSPTNQGRFEKKKERQSNQLTYVIIIPIACITISYFWHLLVS